MGHDQEDDPGSSCLIKQEPADEGIYASSRERTFSEIFSWHNKTDARGLTLQPVRQSLDPQPTHVVWSPSDEENRRLDANLGVHGEGVTSGMLSSSVPQYDGNEAHAVSQAERFDAQSTSERVWFDPFRSVSPPPSQQPAYFDPFRSVSPPLVPDQGDELQEPPPQKSSDSAVVCKIPELSAMQLELEQRLSRTPSPQQSDCFASNSQTPGRSETPPTPIDFEDCFPNEFTLPDDLFGGPLSIASPGKETATSVSEHNPQRQFSTNDINHGTQHVESSAQRTETQSSLAKSVIDLTAELNTSTSLKAGPNHQLFSGAQTAFNPNTPVQSIECQQVQPSPTTVRKPRDRPLQTPDIESDVTFQEQLHKYLADRNQRLGQSGSLTQGGTIGKSESPGKHQQHKRTQSASSSSLPSRLDPSSLHKFSTFMKLRNSLPIATLIAMMAPPNQTQVLTNLAELSGMQVAPGPPQPASHELPATMRSMLDNLMQKLNSDKAFLKSVVTYASGQVLKNDRDEEKAIDPKRILETGLDELNTLRQAREQLLKERIQFQQILSHHEHKLNRCKKQNGDYKKQNSELIAELDRKNAALKAKAEPEPQLNGGSITHNPFWVCGNSMFDGATCSGINQEWYLSRGQGQRKVDKSSKWTLRQICVKCQQPNKGNRRYLTDHEAQMIATYISQPHTSAVSSPQSEPFPLFHQQVVQPLFSQRMAQPVPMYSSPYSPPTTAMSPVAQQQIVYHLPMAQPPFTQYPAAQHLIAQQSTAQQLMPAQQVVQHSTAQYLAAQQPMAPQPMALQGLAQHPVAQPVPITPPVVQHPVVQPTRTNPPAFQSKLTMPQMGPLPSHTSPSTPEPKKRKSTEELTDSPSPKRHSGFNISPSVQDTLRREIPQKAWMKPKEAARVGPGTSSEPIAIDEESTTGNSAPSEESAPLEDDMTSLFGDDENETVDEFEAALCEALDEELRKEGRL